MKLLDYPIIKGHVLDSSSDNHFFDCDSKELFEQNLKTMPSNWPWRDRPIKYNLNSQFYRAPEWHEIDWSDSYVIFGCSHTFGIGINYTDTYAHHLSELLGYPTVNLGVCGSSCMFQWSNTVTLVNNNIKPRGVIYLWPNVMRMLTFKEGGRTVFHGPWHKQDRHRYWMDNAEHCVEFTSRLIDSVDLMWSCPTYHFHLFDEVCERIPKLNPVEMKYNQSTIHSGRDYRIEGKINVAHMGAKCNFCWANEMFEVIRKA